MEDARDRTTQGDDELAMTGVLFPAGSDCVGYTYVSSSGHVGRRLEDAQVAAGCRKAAAIDHLHELEQILEVVHCDLPSFSDDRFKNCSLLPRYSRA
jgi:hypothetical protein